MPTDPLKKLLDRDLQKAAADYIIKEVCPMLQEVVNYGTNAFARCHASANNERVAHIPGDAHLVILMPYRHVIEMIDAIEALLEQSVVNPAYLQLRSAFEAYLQLEWILKEDTKRRAITYLVYDIRNRLKIYSSLDPDTEDGKRV
ncbi:MAG: hypothetical protein HYZ81_12565, partial [Nitrospinae bacterium]|nr:hypothetical protein [Nitrospinota bacterium]